MSKTFVILVTIYADILVAVVRAFVMDPYSYSAFLRVFGQNKSHAVYLPIGVLAVSAMGDNGF